MSSDDLFEKNVGDLIRRGAVKPDAEKARARFLAGTRSRTGIVAAVAAAALIAVTLGWLARPGETPPINVPPALEPAVFVGKGGNELLKGTLTTSDKASMLRFEGRSPLPDGLIIQVRVCRLRERLAGGRLEREVVENPSGTTALKDGRFAYDFPVKGPAPLRLEVSAKDGFQDRELVKRMTLKESEREWTFDYRAWSEKATGLFGPQLVESTDFAAEARDLLARVEASCVSEQEFASKKAALIREAQRLAGRADAFAQAGLYPASARTTAEVAQDLARSMEIFKWEGGKFGGPKDYYTEGKRGRDHRQAPFEFASLRGYLDQAVVVAGREFGLWVVEEYERKGTDLSALVKQHRAHAGVAPFAERLASPGSADRRLLVEELRTISK